MSVQTAQKPEITRQFERKASSQDQTGEIGDFQFQDNRLETHLIQKVRVGGDNRPQAIQLAQLQVAADRNNQQFIQNQTNNTGLPDNLKSGVENLSGYSMDDVNVHYNSSQPTTLQAHAYAQGTDIHVAPGQEQHLPHEAWHVVQQKQGRVNPTRQLKGNVPVNDDSGLEKEADVMGAKAINESGHGTNDSTQLKSSTVDGITQLKTEILHTVGEIEVNGVNQTVGKEMNAKLDPKDPVQGSATGVNSEWMKWIRSKHKAPNVVRGHLLNHDLGGFGIEANLYPISTLANANHSSEVEQNVKGALSDLDGNVKAKDEGHIYYNVKVNEFDSYKKAQFSCYWGKQMKGGNQIPLSPTVNINSDFGEDKGGFGGGKKGKHSPKDWQHGTSKGGAEVRTVRERIEKALQAGNINFSKNVNDGAGKKMDSDEQDFLEYLIDVVEDNDPIDAIHKLTEIYHTVGDAEDRKLIEDIILNLKG